MLNFILDVNKFGVMENKTGGKVLYDFLSDWYD